MEILVCIFSVWALIRSLTYAIYEYKVNQNLSGAICVGVLNIVTFVFVNVMLYLN